MRELNRRCWTEIDLQQLKKNLQIYQKSISPQTEIMAVVKADAYGHGDEIIAKLLFDSGIEYFAVSNIDEAIHIRKRGVGGQILILGYTPINRMGELVKYDITQTLLSEEYADEIAKTNFPIKCQFAIDTGMRRIGLNADEPEKCESVLREYARKLQINGLFTHLCVADTDEEAARAFTIDQIARFEEICCRVTDLNFPYCHCMNSAGGLWHTSSINCITRLGIILYGLKPDYMNILPEGIEPVLSWKSVISMIKKVYPGDTIGYGRTFLVDHPMTIATIPTGYADGYRRVLSNKGYVLINGNKASIVGRICMDQMMIDVTDIPDIHMGGEVVLIGKSGEEKITADDLGYLCGTIGYEIICGISKRVERVYV